jgi:uridine kinase
MQADDVAGITDLIRSLTPRCGPVTVVAIDGGAASGKSSLAARIAPTFGRTPVLHTDDLLDG